VIDAALSERLDRGLRAFERGDAAGMAETATPDVEWHDSGFVPGLAGTYHGVDGLRKWLEMWSDAWEEYSVEALDREEVDEQTFLQTDRLTGRGRHSGVEVEMTVYSLFTMRDGLIARRRVYFGRAEALSALDD
jgi:ketosteroid isomerase-like protein